MLHRASTCSTYRQRFKEFCDVEVTDDHWSEVNDVISKE
jgi:hypothetical protein